MQRGYLVSQFGLPRVDSIDVVKTSEKSYWTRYGRSLKKTQFEHYFDSLAEAREFAIEETKLRIKSEREHLKQKIEKLECRLDELRNMREAV